MIKGLKHIFVCVEKSLYSM